MKNALFILLFSVFVFESQNSLWAQDGAICTLGDNSTCGSGFCVESTSFNVTEPAFNGITRLNLYNAFELSDVKNATSINLEEDDYNDNDLNWKIVLKHFRNTPADEGDSSVTGETLMKDDCGGDEDCLDNQNALMSDTLGELDNMWKSQNKHNDGSNGSTKESCSNHFQCSSINCKNGKCEPLAVCKTCTPEGEKADELACCHYGEAGESTHFVNPDTNICESFYIPKEPWTDYTITIGDACELKFNGPNGDDHPDFEMKISDYVAKNMLALYAVEFLFNTSPVKDCITAEDKPFNELMQTSIADPLKTTRLSAQANFKTAFNTYSENAKARADAGASLSIEVEKERIHFDYEMALLNGAIGQLGGGNVQPDQKLRIVEIGEGYKNINYSRKYAKKVLGKTGSDKKIDKFNCRGDDKKWGKNAWKRRYKLDVVGKAYNAFIFDPPLLSESEFNSNGKKSARDDYRKLEADDETKLKEFLTTKAFEYFNSDSAQTLNNTSTSNDKYNEANNVLFSGASISSISDYAWSLFKSYTLKKHKEQKTREYNGWRRHPVYTRINEFFPGVEAILVENNYYLTQSTQARLQKIECLEKAGAGAERTNADPTIPTGDTNSLPPTTGPEATPENTSQTQVATTDTVGSSAGIGGFGAGITTPTVTGNNNSLTGTTGTGGSLGAQASLGKAASKRLKDRAGLMAKKRQAIANANKQGGLPSASGFAAMYGTAGNKFAAANPSAIGNLQSSVSTSPAAGSGAGASSGPDYSSIADFDYENQGGVSAGSSGDEEELDEEGRANKAAQEEMVQELEKNTAKFESKPLDSLFQIVTKAYIRNLPKMLRRKKK